MTERIRKIADYFRNEVPKEYNWRPFTVSELKSWEGGDETYVDVTPEPLIVEVDAEEREELIAALRNK